MVEVVCGDRRGWRLRERQEDNQQERERERERERPVEVHDWATYLHRKSISTPDTNVVQLLLALRSIVESSGYLDRLQKRDAVVLTHLCASDRGRT